MTIAARPKSNWAQIASAVIAALGFCVVIVQVKLIANNFRIASARQVYMSYSEASLKYPELAEPDFSKIKANPVQYSQYKSFVTHMLFAYDEIFAVYDEPEWRRSFDEDLKPHMPYVCFDMPTSLDEIYFPKMRELLKSERAKCASVERK